MAIRKTLSAWLTNRYLLIIRNEENFAEKKTISFNYARVILILTLAFTITLLIAVYLVTITLEEWLDPRYDRMKTQQELLDLTVGLDSLEYEMALKDQYIKNIQMVVSGDPNAYALLDSQEDLSGQPTELVTSESSIAIDSQFRAEFENLEMQPITYESPNRDEFREMFLFSPIQGLVSDGFNPKADHFGLDIVAKEGEPVKSVSDGVVIFSSWTLDSGYILGIQHRGNLISVYKHNSELLKNVGNFVSGGEVIAIIGNTGELTSGPHLHLELWHNGNPVNPQEYIAF
ncbi:M23 family metallopeptidase [Marinoscillum sp. MHG1-6]|uniref:M23 family metallopeptidase n=1 Tax=Marinoscillum sp. MHG1-6 TaxID=2959627 RepID=UPI0021584721|nr:M23 family metallopeptidase [Marinoscillum sp. MHG1-6]